MSDETPALFKLLTPPPGGLSRLRSRLQAQRQVGRRRRVAGACLALATATSLWLGLMYLSRPPETTIEPQWACAFGETQAAYPTLAVLGLTPVHDEPVALAAGVRHHTALQRLESSDPSVVLYLVGTTGTTIP